MTTSPATKPSPSLGLGAERDDRLAGVDRRPHREVEAGVFLVQLGDRLEDPQRRPDGPLGVVLVRDRRAKDGHHGVADELLDGARRSARSPA